MSAPPLVSLTAISKFFPENGIQACQQVDLDLRAGEIHALIGENGAGKSTLMKILAGLVRPDSGRISLAGGLSFAAGLSPGQAIQAGIGLLLQHSPWAEGLTLEELALLGLRPPPGRGPARARLRQGLRDRAAELGFDLPWHRPCAAVTSLEVQKASLVSLLQRNCRILILDEPTSSLPTSEAERLLTVMRQLADSGLAVVHITHKLAEVIATADRVTVLRQGQVTHRLDRTDLVLERLQDLLLDLEAPPATGPVPTLGSPVLEISGLAIPVTLRAGEILGFGGLREEGLTDLEDFLLAGSGPLTAKLLLHGQALAPGAAGLRQAGVGLIPSQRMTAAVNLAANLGDNLASTHLTKIAPRWWLTPSAIAQFFVRLKAAFNLQGQARDSVASLSGGNIQRLILARELADQPKLVILSEPMWGLDLKSRQELGQRLRDLQANGAAVLILSAEIQDLLDLCDRIGVWYNHRLVEIRPAAEWTLHDLSRRMLGF